MDGPDGGTVQYIYIVVSIRVVVYTVSTDMDSAISSYAPAPALRVREGVGWVGKTGPFSNDIVLQLRYSGYMHAHSTFQPSTLP